MHSHCCNMSFWLRYMRRILDLVDLLKQSGECSGVTLFNCFFYTNFFDIAPLPSVWCLLHWLYFSHFLYSFPPSIFVFYFLPYLLFFFSFRLVFKSSLIILVSVTISSPKFIGKYNWLIGGYLSVLSFLMCFLCPVISWNSVF